MPKPVWTDRQIKKLSGDECASWLTHCFVESSDRNPHVLHPDINFLPLPLSYFSTSTTYLLWRHLSPNGVQKDAAYTGVYCGCASMRSKRLICKVPAEGNISFRGWRRHFEIRPQQDTSANLIGIPYQTKWDLKTDGIKFSICPKKGLISTSTSSSTSFSVSATAIICFNRNDKLFFQHIPNQSRENESLACRLCSDSLDFHCNAFFCDVQPLASPLLFCWHIFVNKCSPLWITLSSRDSYVLLLLKCSALYWKYKKVNL